MNEKKLRDAIDSIEAEDGAQQRMFQNILKKAAAQQETNKAQPLSQAIKEKPNRLLWQKYSSLAACLALVVMIGAIALPSIISTPNSDDLGPVLGNSPIQEVDSAEDFASIDINIDAPSDANDVRYYILDGKIAQIDFILDGHKYTFSASRLDGDLSGVSGKTESSESIDAEHNAVLEQVEHSIWKAYWNDGDMNYFMTNDDGAAKEAIVNIVLDRIKEQ